jgi:protein glucosyltransferase
MHCPLRCEGQCDRRDFPLLGDVRTWVQYRSPCSAISAREAPCLRRCVPAACASQPAASQRGMPLPLPLLLLLLLLLSEPALAGRFDAYTSCEACVAAGFGWSVPKAKCGGYSNTDCSQCEAAPAAPAVADEQHEYSLAVSAARRSYTPCETAHGCFGARIQHDLQPWRGGGGGITRQQFLAAHQKFGSRKLSHYQIIDGQLYRDEKCMFEPRCRGIEYFLHWLLAEDATGGSDGATRLPDMELLINPADNPLVFKGDPASSQLPVFSFSVDGQYKDIMYPAWTFWSGGPAISLYPRGLGRFDIKRDSIIAAGVAKPWATRRDVSFFRGARTTPQRDAIVNFSNEHPDLMDAAYTPNYKKESGEGKAAQHSRSLCISVSIASSTPSDSFSESSCAANGTLRVSATGVPGVDPVPPVELEDHCDYRFLLNARGVAASFRYKHLFLCESLVFNGAREPPPVSPRSLCSSRACLDKPPYFV